MKQKGFTSCLMLFCAFCLIFSVFSSARLANAQSEEEMRIWTKNCALRDRYWNELIFTATQTEDGVSLVAQDRSEYLSVFEGLYLDGEPKIKSRRDKILKMIQKAPGEYSVVISSKLDREVETLWEEIIAKAQSLGIGCK
jgi:hypothetical protein